ncbi:MAG: hypothetical protein ABIY63_14075 [Fibrobacteria bacterium]
MRIPWAPLRARSIETLSTLSTLTALTTATALAVAFFGAAPASAGVTNPDISAVGQVIGGYTDEPGSPDSGQAALNSGEMEMVLDAYLNPFIKGWFTISGGEDGFALEEGYFSVVKGLPWGLNFKAGKYRLGFGKLNASHPHAYPFITPPRAWVSLLPGGEEGFNETGLQVSELLPTPGDWASTLSADLIEAKQFHPDREFTRLGGLGRWANDFLIGDAGALETGLSVATGKSAYPEGPQAYLFGADMKAKFYLPNSSQITVQVEGAYRRFQTLTAAEILDTIRDPGVEPDSETVEDHRSGFVAFADYRYHTQWNGGLLFEQWEADGGAADFDRAFRAFAGYAVLEESTLIRLMYERYLPAGQDAVNSVSLQLLFSMGPHKAHQF